MQFDIIEHVIHEVAMYHPGKQELQLVAEEHWSQLGIAIVHELQFWFKASIELR
jgi:hypothetical protein